MAAKKYYAVRIGKTPGIYNSWEECKANVTGYSNAKYKSFLSYDEAEAYLQMDTRSISNQKIQAINIPIEKEPYAFVDGSYNPIDNIYGFGGFLVCNGEKIILAGSGEEKDMVSMRNVAGEILGAQAAVKEALCRGLSSLTIYYDYSGIEKWVTKEWEANKTGTKRYRDFMDEAKKKMKIRFEKVKGHSGIEGNEEADKLAKYAVGLLSSLDTPETKQDSMFSLVSEYSEKPKAYIKKDSFTPNNLHYWNGIPYGECECGASVDASQNFCSKCGKKLNWNENKNNDS